MFRIRQAKGELHRRPCRIRQAKGELHRARVQVSPPPPRCSESVKLRGNSTGHASRCRLRGTPSWRSGVASVAFRIRQAKGELHRARVRVSPPRCSESVKLRGNSTGHAVFRIRQAKGELHRRPCRIHQAKGELHRARVQVSPPPPRCSESVKLRGNSTGHASRCRLRGSPWWRSGVASVAFRIHQAQGNSTGRGCVATSPGRETQNCRRLWPQKRLQAQQPSPAWQPDRTPANPAQPSPARPSPALAQPGPAAYQPSTQPSPATAIPTSPALPSVQFSPASRPAVLAQPARNAQQLSLAQQSSPAQSSPAQPSPARQPGHLILLATQEWHVSCWIAVVQHAM